MNRTLALAAAAALTGALLGAPTTADAADDLAPPTCATLTDRNCTVAVENYDSDSGDYCQALSPLNGGPIHAVCTDYWPFVNPTIHPEFAPPSAFPAELQQLRTNVSSLTAQVNTAADELKKAKKQIHKLRVRLHQAQAQGH